MLSGDKIDYRSTTVKETPLDVPPDLTQLANDPRYKTAGGSVSATAYQATQAAAAASSPSSTIAVSSAADMHIERDGSERWLVTKLTPEQLWPQLRQFWQERGLTLTVDTPDIGVMETDWAENRAKLPQDIIRRTIGTVFDSIYSTGERDKYRTRVERTAAGSEVFISHRGVEEVYTTQLKDTTVWQPRAPDPQLEAEMLSRLMLKLAAKDAATKTADGSSAAAAAGAAPETLLPSRARVLASGPGAAMQVDEGFDRAWRRVGLALDRTGFTVEDRDRSSGTYYVRYVDPADVGKEEPGFFKRLFGAKGGPTGPVRYRITLKSSGESTNVAVLNDQGAPEAGEAGKRIVSLLVDDLK